MMEQKYKFCVISFVSGTRGALLGHELWKNHQDVFSIRSLHSMHPSYVGQYDFWHNYNPYFVKEIFSEGTHINIKNIFDLPDAQHLHKSKYNIILTHCYTDDELQSLLALLQGHTVKLVQVSFEPNEHDTILRRVRTIFPVLNVKIGENFTTNFIQQLDNKSGYTATGAITIPFASLQGHPSTEEIKRIKEQVEL